MTSALDSPTTASSHWSHSELFKYLYQRVQDRTLDELRIGEAVDWRLRRDPGGGYAAAECLQDVTGVGGTVALSAGEPASETMGLGYFVRELGNWTHLAGEGGVPCSFINLIASEKWPRGRFQMRYVERPEAESRGRNAAYARHIARAMAVERPGVEGKVSAPDLSGNLAEDLRSITGLTVKELAGICRISERRFHDWAGGEAMSARHETRALRLRYLFGLLREALPVSEVRRWLRSPDRSLRESPIQALSAGRDEQVARLIERFLESPAT
jgi:hypothetical protein